MTQLTLTARRWRLRTAPAAGPVDAAALLHHSGGQGWTAGGGPGETGVLTLQPVEDAR